MQGIGTVLAVCALLIGAVVQGAAQGAPESVIYAGGVAVPFEQMVQNLGAADVVFVGENHDDKRAHALELQILEGLYHQNPRLALSLEMFERDVQGVLDEYLQDDITEPQFLAASRPWNNYKEDYRPLVEFCKAHRLPVIAANAPRRYVNIVSRKGQEALLRLPRPSRAYLAPLPYPMDLPAGYNKQLDEIFGGDGSGQPGAHGAGGPPPALMKQAQALWDSTMADSLLRALRRYPGCKLLQMNGGMHSDAGWGIVDRLRRARPRLKILIVSIKPDPDFTAPHPDKYGNAGDFLILTRSEKAVEKSGK